MGLWQNLVGKFIKNSQPPLPVSTPPPPIVTPPSDDYYVRAYSTNVVTMPDLIPDSKVTKERFLRGLELYRYLQQTTYDSVSSQGGLTLGIGSWSMESGKLQNFLLIPIVAKVLKPTFDDYFPFRFSGTLGVKGPAVIDLLHKNGVRTDSGEINPAWLKSFKKFLNKPLVVLYQQEIFYQAAAQADAHMREWEMDSDLAYGWFFYCYATGLNLRELGIARGSIGAANWLKAIKLFPDLNIPASRVLTEEERVLMAATYMLREKPLYQIALRINLPEGL